MPMQACYVLLQQVLLPAAIKQRNNRCLMSNWDSYGSQQLRCTAAHAHAGPLCAGTDMCCLLQPSSSGEIAAS